MVLLGESFCLQTFVDLFGDDTRNRSGESLESRYLSEILEFWSDTDIRRPLVRTVFCEFQVKQGSKQTLDPYVYDSSIRYESPLGVR